jgi:S-adenosyl-L-methionine hydrolase (adenosine-forming)
MIALFTDFGLTGPYTGQVKAVLQREAPAVPVVDLFADAPIANPKAAAYLLAAYSAWFEAGTIFLCVVDPGVGSARTFADRPPGDAFWYENSNGLAEIAVNQGRADRLLGLAIGSAVSVAGG